MRHLSTAFYMLISILGLSVLSFISLLGVQYYRGKITSGDIHSIFRVIGGTHRIIIPNETYDRYVEYAGDEQKAREELERNRGLPETREPPAIRALEAQETLRAGAEVQQRLLDEQKRANENLRAEVEAQKLQVQSLIRALDDERQKKATVERDAATAKLRKTLSEMDAGDIGLFLSQIIRDPSQGGPPEAARIIQSHLPSDFAAEVLGEMTAPDRQQVLPLLENRLAGVPPEAVVKMFEDARTSPGEILVYLSQMNPVQALGVYLRLPAPVQEQLSPQILRAL